MATEQVQIIWRNEATGDSLPGPPDVQFTVTRAELADNRVHVWVAAVPATRTGMPADGSWRVALDGDDFAMLVWCASSFDRRYPGSDGNIPVRFWEMLSPLSRALINSARQGVDKMGAEIR